MTNLLMIKKGGVGIHVAYGHTFSNNLYAHNSAITLKPDFALHLDLNPNLHKRAKESNQVVDARELADGAIARLEMLQLDDRKIIDTIYQILARQSTRFENWRLVIKLEKTYEFLVRPELRGVGGAESLFLHVL